MAPFPHHTTSPSPSELNPIPTTTTSEERDHHTPISREFNLPQAPLNCPSTPRKPRPTAWRKRSTSEAVDLIVLSMEDLESLFRPNGCLSTVELKVRSKKRRHILN
ncbi:hypothetical protein HPP92_022574 [Vanilla planifolia]|uniref:Uncharacterized protein n=1 Tax=Vanilla planifolia TaxID=51239 RepID=A0A835UDB8_VANPL|nr:hypothetical protein HPP92_022574 [Vanilla planifolia]